MWGIPSKHLLLLSLLLFILLSYTQYPSAETTTHDASLMEDDLNATVTLMEGQLPLIISVPHGSLQLPATMPNRTSGQLIADAYTISVGHQLSHLLQQHYNAAPYVVILNVARRKVDVNRPIDQACESAQSRRVWEVSRPITGISSNVKKISIDSITMMSFKRLWTQ
jgi:hypothetical protein